MSVGAATSGAYGRPAWQAAPRGRQVRTTVRPGGLAGRRCEDVPVTSGTTQDFRFRDILLVAYGPSVVSAIGHGAMLPVLALRARDLGADVSVAAAIVALLGVGQLLASLPAGALVARIGERRALVGRGPRRRLRDGLRGADRLGPGAGGRGPAQRRVLDVVPHRPAGLHDRRRPGEPPGAGDVAAGRVLPRRGAHRAAHRGRADRGLRPDERLLAGRRDVGARVPARGHDARPRRGEARRRPGDAATWACGR